MPGLLLSPCTYLPTVNPPAAVTVMNCACTTALDPECASDGRNSTLSIHLGSTRPHHPAPSLASFRAGTSRVSSFLNGTADALFLQAASRVLARPLAWHHEFGNWPQEHENHTLIM